MTIPLDPSLYEDLTPTAAQNIAAYLGQSLGAYGVNQLRNYRTGNALEALGLSREIARLPKNIQDQIVKSRLQQQQINSAISQYQNIDPYADTLTPTTTQPQQLDVETQATATGETIDQGRRPAMPYIFRQQDRINKTANALSIIDPKLAKDFRVGEDAIIEIYKERARQEFRRLEPILNELDKEKGQYAIKKKRIG